MSLWVFGIICGTHLATYCAVNFKFYLFRTFSESGADVVAGVAGVTGVAGVAS
jgi:hypothetical protein